MSKKGILKLLYFSKKSCVSKACKNHLLLQHPTKTCLSRTQKKGSSYQLLDDLLPKELERERGGR